MNYKELKDWHVCRSFEHAAAAVEKLQKCSTFELYKDAVINPKCQHFMFSYDELSVNKSSLRDDPISVVLKPKHVTRQEFGNELVRIGTEVLLNKNDRVLLTSDPKRYYKLLFGGRNRNVGQQQQQQQQQPKNNDNRNKK